MLFSFSVTPSHDGLELSLLRSASLWRMIPCGTCVNLDYRNNSECDMEASNSISSWVSTSSLPSRCGALLIRTRLSCKLYERINDYGRVHCSVSFASSWYRLVLHFTSYARPLRLLGFASNSRARRHFKSCFLISTVLLRWLWPLPWYTTSRSHHLLSPYWHSSCKLP